METNILLSNILDVDSYKFSHWPQYPQNTTAMFSYLESRGGRYDHTVFFGLQYYLKEYLSKPVTMAQVDEAAGFAKAHGVPFNYEGWKYIVEEHSGFIPVKIRAVAEGSIIPTHNILMSVESTDSKVFWVVSWLETMLSRIWYSITVATQSWSIKQHIYKVLQETSDNPDAEIPFKLHDFGSRGVSSQESAMIGGAAHLVNFMGSDTVAGIWMANKYYNHKMAAFSIPAAEHSTITMWGKDAEACAYANMLEQYSDSPLMAVVSDSYDIYNAITNIWGGELRAKVIDYKGTLVIRPDSGDPVEVVATVLEKLEQAFGATKNSKGFKVINNDVRVLQGDGINEQSIKDILAEVVHRGYSATNLAFGMGGALLQQVNRDTQKFAFKCSWAIVDGKEVLVYKDPVTDHGKKSKKGRLDLVKERNGEVHTVRYNGVPNKETGLMNIVYFNGTLSNECTLDEIRDRSKTTLEQYRGWSDYSL